jgi:putative transcriptional regulator
VILHESFFTAEDSELSKRKINNNIRTLRFFKDEMSQQQLADATGVTRQTINAIEKGKYSPSLELAFKIALVFKVPLEEVFTYDPLEDTKKKSKEK